MERQHISPILHGLYSKHQSGSLARRYVGIPTAVVSGLTLNMLFSIYTPLSVFRDIFLLRVDCHRAVATAVTTDEEGLRPHVARRIHKEILISVVSPATI